MKDLPYYSDGSGVIEGVSLGGGGVLVIVGETVAVNVSVGSGVSVGVRVFVLVRVAVNVRVGVKVGKRVGRTSPGVFVSSGDQVEVAVPGSRGVMEGAIRRLTDTKNNPRP